mgnify:CR=1 FL=1
MKRSKRYRTLLEKIDKNGIYDLREAIEKVKELRSAKFTESVELTVKLKVDPKRHTVRGSVVLPHGTGKTRRVLVFTEEKEKEAKEAGADYVGSDDLIEKVSKGWFEFDYVIATPEVMKKVARLGKILGPKGLMPSPKTGTVTQNVKEAIEAAKRGKVDFKMDKTGCIHGAIGKVDLDTDKLYENATQFLRGIWEARPQEVKGSYFESVYLSLTMSPSLRINLQDAIKIASRGE